MNQADDNQPPGNTKLVEYGIYSEESDIRAHVCPLAKCVYIYRTTAGIEAIEAKEYPLKPVWTRGIKTAEGYVVPPDDIRGCVAVKLRDCTWEALNLRKEMKPDVKGKRAATLVEEMIKRGHFPVPMIGEEVNDLKTQIEGTDIKVSVNNLKIQVKCDLEGGGTKGENGCTGNLFLQVRECNPWGYY
jgi:hypothetical protein